MIEIKKNLEKYYQIFKSYEVFQNFIKYAARDLSPQIFVEDEENPQCIVFYSNPAYFILGEPSEQHNKNVFSLFKEDSWIIASSNAWKQAIQDHFKDRAITHPRIQFSSSSLNLDHILDQRRNVPKGLFIVPIEKKHVTKGMIYDDVISKFFTQSDFLSNGFGFALVDDEGECQGFSLTNYPIVGQEIELYFRVGYESYQHHRQQGLGTTLCTYFIEESFKRGYVPIWDSANDISTHIAKKLGYEEEKAWFMYHLL
jgi:hypothetical protein